MVTRGTASCGGWDIPGMYLYSDTVYVDSSVGMPSTGKHEALAQPVDVWLVDASVEMWGWR